MTPEQQNKLEAIKAALKQHIDEAEKATPGPWAWTDQDDEDIPPYVPQCSYLGDTLVALTDTYEGSREDCAFIARARTMSPLACKMALIGIQSLEDIYNGNGHYLVHADIDLCAIINAWEGGQL